MLPALTLQLRPLPSALVTRVTGRRRLPFGTMGLSDSPPGPDTGRLRLPTGRLRLSLVPRGPPVDGLRHHREGSPVLRLLSLPTCRRHYPGGPVGSYCSGHHSPLSPTATAFPLKSQGRRPRWLFRGLLGVHVCPSGRSLRPAGSLSRPRTALCRRKLQPIRHLFGCSDCYRAEQ